MNAKILLAALFLTLPVLAQDSPPQVSVSTDDIENCANYSINYALFVYVAHYTPKEEDFKKFVEEQVEHQPPNLAGMVRKFGEEAWRERNIPPSIAGMDVFKQCEAHLFGVAPKVRRLPTQSWDQENLKRNDTGCPTAIFVAPGGNLIQCE